MALSDFFNRVRGVDSVEGDRVFVLRDEQLAHAMRAPDGVVWDASEPPTCKKCERKQEARIIATDLPRGTSALWDERPIVVDGWMCERCGLFEYPRTMTPERITSFGRKNAELAGQGRWREAEWWLTRIAWDWPGYAPAHIDLAQVLEGRHADTPEGDPARSALLRRAQGAWEKAVELMAREPEQYPVRMRAFAHLGLVEAAIHRRNPELAWRTLEACSSLGELDEDTEQRASELELYLREERWVFADAAAVVNPHMHLMEGPGAPVETPDNRARLATAVEALEGHYAAHPSHWQSLFVAAKGREALGEASRALELWRQAWRAHPGEAHIVRELARALLAIERHEEAREVNRDATERMPAEATLWCNRAVTEVLCGDLDAARACVAKSRELDPDDPIAEALERRLAQLTPDRLPRTLRELEGRPRFEPNV